MKKLVIISFVIFVISIGLYRFSFSQDHEPDLKWLTLETPHFFIHFPQGFEDLGQKIGFLCEDVYEPVGKSLNYFPKRTHVVVHTRSDFSNGLAAPLPWRMELYLTAPQTNRSGTRDDWLRVLITHEFTHIVHLRKTKGISSITYPLFGELNSFWQGLTPYWFIEGIATLNETRFTNGGRGRNPYHFMEMSAPILANKPWKLEHTNYLSRKKLPLGMYYVSGYFLTNYIKNQAGADVWKKVIDVYSSSPVLGFNHALKKVTGKSPKQYYDEVLQEIELHFENTNFSTEFEFWPIKNKNQAREEYILNRIPTNEYSPRWINRDNLVHYQYSFDKLPALIQINQNGDTKKLIEIELTSENNCFDIGENYLVWAELKPHLRFSATVYSDIKLLNLQTKQIRTVTKNARITSLDLSPDEKQLVAGQNVLPKTRLVSIQLESGKVKPLLEIKNATILNPRWSFDNKIVVFVLKDSTGRQNIALYDLALKTWRYLYDPDEFQDNNPCLTTDGTTVLYTSDRSGIYNIWAVDVQTGQRWQVTDVPLGAFFPDVSQDGNKMAFSSYTYSGFVTAVMPLKQQNWIAENFVQTWQLPSSLQVNKLHSRHNSDVGFSEIQPKNYQSWKQILKPQGWLPMIFEFDDEYSPGFFALSEDALHRHFWQAGVGYSLESKKPFYDIFYQYSRFWPKVGFNLYNTPRKVVYKEFTGWWHKQGFFTSVAIPIILRKNVYTTFLQPFIGYKYETQKQATGILFPRYEKYRGIRAGFQFFQASQTFRDVAPHQLTSFSCSYDWTNPDLSSQFKGHQVTAQFNLILPTLFKHHQLQLMTAYQARRSTYSFSSSGVVPIGYEDDYKRQHFRFKTGYHFPIAFLEWPIPFSPFYFDYISGSVFYDWSTSWNHGIGKDRWAEYGKASMGLQLTLSTVAFQYVPVRGSLAVFYRSALEDLSFEANLSVDLVY